MKNIRTILSILAVMVVVGLSQAVLWGASGPNLVTIDRLQAAYRVEINAEARYSAFAVKADEEGYKQVANLFRAVARSEQIQYTGAFDTIKALGGTPENVNPAEAPVGNTKENLEKSSDKAALEQMDSDFASHAKAAHGEGNRDAAKVFEAVRLVEAQNFRLFSAAAKSLESMRGTPRGYFLCGVTGFVSTNMDAMNCSSPDWEKVK